MSFKKFTAEGYLSLLVGAIFSVAVLGLSVYFVIIGAPNSTPEQLAENIIEDVLEGTLGLKEGTIELDFSPCDKNKEE